MGKTERKQKRLRPIRCICGSKIDVNCCYENDDYDYTDKTKTSIYVYCGECGMQHEYKL